uniref:Retrovirus-related Pol polyprotein from transposon TNT 1-94 n=1 Tax=Cajanus cajan TaxID=3821 RepID=A0A151SDV1_CAJCA|nr:Retrovirus-related Pol polyprotein from transposon TNT 1-94 [Cajanus cajan]
MKHPQWLVAMEDELSALHNNHTWTLVPRPFAPNIVGSKWIFRTKHKSDSTIERLKARLVAQGFTQIPGFDYSITFSPVVKATTIRLILSLPVLNGWPLHQLDVKNAFLHGHLTETIYMEQPPVFVDPRFLTHVCLLNKALYGLKQAPRAWFQRLSSFLMRSGFICSRADPSLFFFYRGRITLYLLVYVDDIILTGSDPPFLTQFIARLNAEFAIKYLGKLGYFLGLEITYTADGLFLGQAKYAHDLLSRAMMLEAKPVSTPLAAGFHLVSDGVAYSDPTQYRSLVGALQYLTITRPDLSYAVNTVSQFLQAPTIDHFQTVKCILCYVCGTQHFGLTFRSSPSPAVLGYSDADWARCTDTHRSTYDYVVFLGDNLLSWSAKKQPTVARSSCESEYRAMANTASELVWLLNLLRELRVGLSATPLLLSDNQSALFMAQNPVAHKHAKHIDLDCHFIRELVASGRLAVRHVPTSLQLADIFTKALSRPLFELFRSKLRVGLNPTLSLTRGVKS